MYFGTNIGVIAPKHFEDLCHHSMNLFHLSWPHLFSAYCWHSSHSKHPRLHSSVVAGRPKQDWVEIQTDASRGLHRSRAVWLHCPSCAPHRLLHPRSHHHPTEGWQRWATHVESAEILLSSTPLKYRACLLSWKCNFLQRWRKLRMVVILSLDFWNDKEMWGNC